VNDGELFSIIGPNGAGKTDRQLHLGPLPAGRQIVLSQPRHYHSIQRKTRLGIGHCLPERSAVPSYERARQHHGRAASPDGIVTGSVLVTGAQQELEHRRKVEEIIDFLDRSRCANHRRHAPLRLRKRVGCAPPALSRD
jgi:branched-chain amino acid transport system ATP-binding protein